jgi:hypothetical protein
MQSQFYCPAVSNTAKLAKERRLIETKQRAAAAEFEV